VEWLGWEGFGPFWAQLTRKLMRSKESDAKPLSLTEVEGGYRVELDTLDANDNFVEPDLGELLAMNPDGAQSIIPFEQIAPGRMQAFWPTGRSGAYHAQVRLEDGGETTHTQYTHFSKGVSEEFLPRPSDKSALELITQTTGGWMVEPDSELTSWFKEDDRTAILEQEIWPWLALAALILFIADVANKRWPDARFN